MGVTIASEDGRPIKDTNPFPVKRVDSNGNAVDSGIQTSTATIANGASLSGAVDLSTRTLVGILMPANWTAANLTFQGSADGTNYFNVYDNLGSEVQVNADASRYIPLNPADWVGIRYLKVRSGTSGSAVNQGADRVVTLISRGV